MAHPASRPLGFLDVTCIGINAIVGSSIFLFPDDLARHLGPASVLSFGLTGLLLISVGLCFAEVASRFGRTGGPYLYARAAFGDWPGYAIGWMCWVTSILAWAAVANAVPTYLRGVSPALSSPPGSKAVAAGVIAVLAALNYRGVKLGAWASNFFTAAKLIPLAIFVLAGLPQIQGGAFSPLAPRGWRPLGPACFLAYFAFQGFEVVPVPAGEVDRPQRNIPLAVVTSLMFSALLYMLVQAVAVGVHPGLALSERPLADAALAILGPAGAALMVAGAVCSTTGFTAGTALVCPRYLTALAADGHLPPSMAEPHARYGTPSRAILVTTGLALLGALALDFQQLVDFGNVVVCAQYLSTCAALPLLRRPAAAPGPPAALIGGRAPVSLPGGPVLPVAGTAATLWLGSQGGWDQLVWAAGALVLGLILSDLWRSWDAARRPAGPAPRPERPAA